MGESKTLSTSHVELGHELSVLVEGLAEYLHEVLDPRLIRDRAPSGRDLHGSQKADAGRTPYSKLSEREREGRRRWARQLLRAIAALGFRVLPPESLAEFEVGSAAVGAGATGQSVSAARRHADKLIGAGESLLAWEAIEAALNRWPGDLRLRQLRGVALARSGDTARANREMRKLLDEGHGDAETLGILARTHKDQAFCAQTAQERVVQLERAFVAYRQGYDAALRSGHAEDVYFTGINAATLSLLLGESERASELAKEVRARCYQELEHGSSDASYWLHATLAEAALLLGDRAEAEEHYGRAAERCGTRYADCSTTRRQARLILQKRDEDPGWLEKTLRVPPVAIFTGHMIDHPERSSARFPPELEKSVAGLIRDHIRRVGPVAGYGSAACGADILFLEAMISEGREFHVILPVPPAEFLQTSVNVAPGGDWPQRFERVLASATSVTVASERQTRATAETLDYANLISTGLAALHARILETGLVGLAVWDGRTGDGPGGTASLVQQWEARGIEIIRIDLGGAAREGEIRPPGPASKAAAADQTAGEALPHELVAMVFADAVGYSKLTEEQVPLFVAHFFNPIAELIANSSHQPILKETMGDGLYLVFQDVADAGDFALALRDLASRINWELRGLPPTMGLRIALHCGPVLRLVDPITGLNKYTGPHTSRVARIEPITPPGQVYASQAFAAVAAARGIESPVFEYVGHTDLAKEYGSLPLYHVRRA